MMQFLKESLHYIYLNKTRNNMIFDFNIHLPYLNNQDVNKVVEQDLKLNQQELITGFDYHYPQLKKLNGGNFLLFNVELFNSNLSEFINLVNSRYQNVSLTALVDFRSPNIFKYLEILSQSKVNAVMVNSYLQKITIKDYDLVIKAFKYASKLGLLLCIDGSYGTSKMFKYDNLKLACAVADKIPLSNIIIIHSGGFRLIQALLLALDKKNVWLDTSFSLPYYKNSSIEIDFAFAIKKLNCERVLFGSDHPYIKLEDALRSHYEFFEKYNFKTNEIDLIMNSNALRLLNV